MSFDNEYLTISEAAKATGKSKKAITRRLERGTLSCVRDDQGIRRIPKNELFEKVGKSELWIPEYEPDFTISGDNATVNTPVTPSAEVSDAETYLKERGLDPDDWEIERLRVGKWGPPGTEQEQLRFEVRRKKPKEILLPARAEGYRYNGSIATGYNQERLVVCVGDQQAPFQDKHLHECFLAFLEDQQPAEGVLLGDTIDLNDISRHRKNPDRAASVQECVNAGYNLLRDYREASVNTSWKKLAGNHDERLRNIFIDKLADFYGTTRAQVDGEELPVHSVEFLLRLDELGIEFIDPAGPYDQAQINITPYLAARHGWLTKQGSGATALKSLEALGYSIIVGHTHRQAIVKKSVHDIDGNLHNHVGVEAGCMCEVGLGYAVAEDWTQGFVTVSVHEDGKFNVDLATYTNGKLYWRDEVYY